MRHRHPLFIGCALAAVFASSALAAPPRAAERLDRGVVAVPAKGGGVLVSWRLLASDPRGVAFDVYRDGKKLNPRPLTQGTDFVDAAGGPQATYVVRAGKGGPSGPAKVWADGYLTLPLDKPKGGVTPDGVAYEYTANDASVGDLDGDGRYEIVLKWDPTNSKDNAFGGYTGPVLLDAYTLEGKRLWRIDLGRNIRAGAHYTQFQVFDFDGDGKAEVAARTSDGTVDGTGKMLGDANADWREAAAVRDSNDRTGSVTRPDGSRGADVTGRILKGPEFLTVFEGTTGRALASAPFSPARHPDTANPTPDQLKAYWGDGYGNRSDRFLAGTAFLDGRHASIIMGRGYYGHTLVAAWDWRGGKLTRRWLFDSDKEPEGYAGQGNHNLAVADVDGDGRDEIVYGSMAIDDNGHGLWTAKLRHGDALHVGDLDPTHPGLEKFGVHEEATRNGGIGAAMLDARTGKVLWSTPADHDIGRGVAFDVDPRHPGAEAWAANSDQIFTAQGQPIGKRPQSYNFGVWWDGDLLRELLDKNEIMKWDWTAEKTEVLLKAEGASSNNGTKSNPALSADILGDWREEVIWRTDDSTALQIYTTPYPTVHRFTTLMADPVYRAAVAAQNTAYNQPPHLSYFLGAGMKGETAP